MVVQTRARQVGIGEEGVLRDTGTELDGRLVVLVARRQENGTLVCHFLLETGLVVEAPYRFFRRNGR